MKTGKPSAVRCSLRRLWALSLGLWLAAMSLLTWAVAADFQIQIRSQAQSIAPLLPPEAPLPDALPGQLQDLQVRQLGEPYRLLQPEQALPFLLPARPNGISNHSPLWGNWNLIYGFEAAVVFPGGPAPVATGQQLTMQYTTAETRKQNDPPPLGMLQLDLAPLLEGKPTPAAPPDDDLLTPLLLPLVRMRGSFDGNRFLPLSLERQMDGRWSLLWGDPAADAPETVYGWEVFSSIVADQPVTFGGTRYASLSDLLQESLNGPFSCDRRGLREGIVQVSAPDSAAVMAVRYWPLTYAVTRMIPVYLVTLALCILAAALLQHRLQKNLLRPLRRLRDAAAKGDTLTPCAAWQEVYDLESHFAAAHQTAAESAARIQRLTASLDYAREAEHKRRELISSLTHQLKNPLAVIHSYAEALQADIQSQKREQYLGVIQEETEKMDEIVLQMLDFSRLEAGKVKLNISTFSLPALVRSVTAQFRALMEEKRLELTLQMEDVLLLSADESRMEQVLSNLVSNAVKYTPSGGRIRIRAVTEDKSLRLTVENTAEPLAPEELERIWDSFYRCPRTAGIPGTGLGLAIVRQIVLLHGGSCRAGYSRQDQALCFSITLPTAI